jgi:hypothetical protein
MSNLLLILYKDLKKLADIAEDQLGEVKDLVNAVAAIKGEILPPENIKWSLWIHKGPDQKH